MRSEGYSGWFVCVCVSTLNMPPHTLKSQNRDTNGFIAIQESFNFNFLPIFLKCFFQKLWHNLLTSSSSSVVALFFFNEISFYASFEAYSYVSTAQTTGLWKTACDSLAQTREWHRYTDHEWALTNYASIILGIIGAPKH